jgi:hypothetical protein
MANIRLLGYHDIRIEADPLLASTGELSSHRFRIEAEGKISN